MAKVETEEDIRLIEKIRKGEVLAFESLLNKYQARLLDYVGNWLDDTNDQEEVVQDVFLKFYRNIQKFDIEKKVLPYLYGIAKNTVIDKLRKQKKTLPLFEEFVGQTEDGVMEFLEKEEQNKRLYWALSQIKTSYRKVLHLYYFEELSYKKIEQKLKWPLNTVRTNLRRAKDALAKKLSHERRK